MSELAKQIYDLLRNFWCDGATVAQIADVTNTTELEVTAALSEFHPKLDFRMRPSGAVPSFSRNTIVWFLKSEEAECCL